MADLFVDLSSLRLVKNYENALSCIVTGPAGERVSAYVEHVSPLNRDIKFFPYRDGNYNVYIYYGQTLVPGCPYLIEVDGGTSMRRARLGKRSIQFGV